MELLTLAIPLIAALVAVLRGWLQTTVTPKRLGVITELARTVVSAAEEVDRALDLPPADKYDYAESALISSARRIGVKLRPEEANAFIHAVLNESRLTDELLALEAVSNPGVD